MFETLEARDPTKSFKLQISDQCETQARKKAKHLVLVRKSSGTCLSF